MVADLETIYELSSGRRGEPAPPKGDVSVYIRAARSLYAARDVHSRSTIASAGGQR